MTTPSFDSVEAQASYGIGLQVGQQLLESGLQGLQPEALLAGLRDALEGNLTCGACRCGTSRPA